jgi:lysozyme family protein
VPVSEQFPEVPADQSKEAPPAGETPAPAGADTSKLTTFANTAFVGIPAAYATTSSVTVTVITAIMAIGFVLLIWWIVRRGARPAQV